MTERPQRPDAYTRWLADEIQAGIDDPRQSIPHDEVMAEMTADIEALAAGQIRPTSTNPAR